jgi:hypothetical protein
VPTAAVKVAANSFVGVVPNSVYQAAAISSVSSVTQ